MKRSNESEENSKIRGLVDATRHFDKRSEETEEEHESRLFQQNVRQKELLSRETPDERKSRQNADSDRKASKRAAGAAAYEDTYKPMKNWSDWINSDTSRHHKWYDALDADSDRKKISRAAESNEKKRAF